VPKADVDTAAAHPEPEHSPEVARRRPLLPARLRPVNRPKVALEIFLVLAAYWLYGLVRNGVPTHESAAIHRALHLLAFERTLGLDVELPLNTFVAGIRWLAVASNYYYATLHFVVTIATLVWLYVQHPTRYRAARCVLYATNTLALLGFYFLPLAPPRFLHGAGFVDTVVVFHTWGSWASGDVAAASNQYAAMPSLHIAWSLWSGVTVAMLARRGWVRLLGACYPFATCFVIVATANHFVLDAVGGAAVLACGYAVQYRLTGRRAVTSSPPTGEQTPRPDSGRQKDVEDAPRKVAQPVDA
jgi:PAP2 superfamily protein